MPEIPFELEVARQQGYAVEPDAAERYVQTYRRSDGSAADEGARRRFEALPEATRRALSEPYLVSPAAIAQYAEDGYIHLSGVLPSELVTVLGESIVENTMARNPRKGEAMEGRTTYNQAFIQVGGVWRHGGLSELFSFSGRLVGHSPCRCSANIRRHCHTAVTLAHPTPVPSSNPINAAGECRRF